MFVLMYLIATANQLTTIKKSSPCCMWLYRIGRASFCRCRPHLSIFSPELPFPTHLPLTFFSNQQSVSLYNSLFPPSPYLYILSVKAVFCFAYLVNMCLHPGSRPDCVSVSLLASSVSKVVLIQFAYLCVTPLSLLPAEMSLCKLAYAL